MHLIVTSLVCCLLAGSSSPGEELSRLTTLNNPSIRCHVTCKPYVILKRSEVLAVVVDNSAVDDDILPGHLAGCSGLASLTHVKRSQNLFVPSYAGLNFEHIHNGTNQDDHILLKPRRVPMELRVIDAVTCQLYQAPTPHWKLES